MITKEKLKRALKTSTRWKRDECEDYNLLGERGKVYFDDNNWYVYFKNHKKGFLKEELSFMEVWQEGDAEIIFRAQKMPDSQQATKIRNFLGLRTRKTFSPETLQKMTENLQKARLKTQVARGVQPSLVR